jgi:hypothetical protein
MPSLVFFTFELPRVKSLNFFGEENFKLSKIICKVWLIMHITGKNFGLKKIGIVSNHFVTQPWLEANIATSQIRICQVSSETSPEIIIEILYFDAGLAICHLLPGG